MPYLGHREPDMADLGISPTGAAPVLAQDYSKEETVRRMVGRVARSDEDRQLLLEALGLIPTVHQQGALAS